VLNYRISSILLRCSKKSKTEIKKQKKMRAFKLSLTLLIIASFTLCQAQTESEFDKIMNKQNNMSQSEWYSLRKQNRRSIDKCLVALGTIEVTHIEKEWYELGNDKIKVELSFGIQNATDIPMQAFKVAIQVLDPFGEAILLNYFTNYDCPDCIGYNVSLDVSNDPLLRAYFNFKAPKYNWEFDEEDDAELYKQLYKYKGTYLELQAKITTIQIKFENGTVLNR
jgi:hypothetical protein